MIHLEQSELQWERRKGSFVLFFFLETNEGNSSTRLLGRRNQRWSFGQNHELPSPSDWTGKKAEMWDYRRTQSGDGCTLEPQSQSPLMLHPCPWEPSVCVCVLSFYFILQLINTAVLVLVVQQRHSVLHMHVSILFQIHFPFSLLCNTEQSSLCYTVGPF